MCSTWAATVLGAMDSADAISRLVAPVATSRATSAAARLIQQDLGALPEPPPRVPRRCRPRQRVTGLPGLPLMQVYEAPGVVDGGEGARDPAELQRLGRPFDPAARRRRPRPGGEVGAGAGDDVREQVGGVADVGGGGEALPVRPLVVIAHEGAREAEAHQADLKIEGDEGVHFETAWLDPDSGKAFCLSTGPSKEAVMRIHERAGHPTSEVYELTVEV